MRVPPPNGPGQLLFPKEADTPAPKQHIMGVAGRQQTEERLLLVSGISIGQNHRVFLRHRPLYMVRLSVVYPNKRLLDGNGPLQHGLHRYVIGPAEETADIDHMVAVGNQGIYAYSVVPDHAPPRRSDPAAEAAIQSAIFSWLRST